MEKIDIYSFNHLYRIYRNRLPSSIKNKIYSIGLDAVKQDSYALKDVPKKLRDYNICITAVNQNGLALMFVPEELPEYKDICLVAVKQNGKALMDVPKELRDYDICMAAVRQNSSILRQFVPPELQSRIIEELGL
jgi:hypothetical protein